MPRYVLLEHDHPVLHWDLMLESADALHTWRLPQPPRTAEVLPAVRIGEHRLAYLDYEGPLSGNRGRVRRCDAGHFEWLQHDECQIVLRLNGGTLKGLLRLDRQEGDQWLLRFEADGAP
jgi:hypothetical protein